MRKIEIILQIEKEKFVIEKLKPLFPRNMLLMNLKKMEMKNKIKSKK